MKTLLLVCCSRSRNANGRLQVTAFSNQQTCNLIGPFETCGLKLCKSNACAEPTWQQLISDMEELDLRNGRKLQIAGRAGRSIVTCPPRAAHVPHLLCILTTPYHAFA